MPHAMTILPDLHKQNWTNLGIIKPSQHFVADLTGHPVAGFKIKAEGRGLTADRCLFYGKPTYNLEKRHLCCYVASLIMKRDNSASDVALYVRF